MHRSACIALLVAMTAAAPAAAAPPDVTALTSATPATLKPVTFGESKTQAVTIYGSGLAGPNPTVSHDSRQWEHWQVRLVRDGVPGAWVACSNGTLDFNGCQVPSGNAGTIKLLVGGGLLYFLKPPTEAWLDVRFWYGLASSGDIEPSNATGAAPLVSNVLRIPINNAPIAVSPGRGYALPQPTPTPRPPQMLDVTPKVGSLTTLATTLVTVTCTTPVLADRTGTPITWKAAPLAVKEGQTVYAFTSTIDGPSGKLRAIDIGTRAWIADRCVR